MLAGVATRSFSRVADPIGTEQRSITVAFNTSPLANTPNDSRPTSPARSPSSSTAWTRGRLIGSRWPPITTDDGDVPPRRCVRSPSRAFHGPHNPSASSAMIARAAARPASTDNAISPSRHNAATWPSSIAKLSGNNSLSRPSVSSTSRTAGPDTFFIGGPFLQDGFRSPPDDAAQASPRGGPPPLYFNNSRDNL